MRKIFAIIALLTFSASEVFALTLEEAVSKALENNISIKRERINLEAAERSSKHSWNKILPSLSLSATDEITIPIPESQHNYGVEGKAEVSISSDFFASIKKAKADYHAARISYEEALAEILSQVKASFFSLIYEKENLAYLRENLENAKNQTEQNEERYKRGTLSELEYLSSKVSYEKLKPDLKAQELSYKNDLKNFSLILGIEEGEGDLSPEGSLEDFISQYKTFFDESMMKNISEDLTNEKLPSVELLKKQLEASQKDLSKTKLSVWGPSLNLSYSMNPVLSGEEKGQIKQTAAIGLSLPLENHLPFSQGADAIKTAQDSVKDLQLQLEEKIKTVNADYNSLVNSLEQKNESIKSLKAFVQLTQQNYKAAQLSYSKGTMELLSMQNAAKENLEAKLNLQNEFLENLKLYISLEKLTGKEVVR